MSRKRNQEIDSEKVNLEIKKRKIIVSSFYFEGISIPPPLQFPSYQISKQEEAQTFLKLARESLRHRIEFPTTDSMGVDRFFPTLGIPVYRSNSE